MTAPISFIDKHLLDFLDSQAELDAEFAEIYAEQEAREKGLPDYAVPDDDADFEIPFNEKIRGAQ